MNYWYFLWFAFGLVIQTAVFMWVDNRPHNVSHMFINILNTASKLGMGNKTIDELLQDAELVDVGIWLKRRG